MARATASADAAGVATAKLVQRKRSKVNDRTEPCHSTVPSSKASDAVAKDGLVEDKLEKIQRRPPMPHVFTTQPSLLDVHNKTTRGVTHGFLNAFLVVLMFYLLAAIDQNMRLEGQPLRTRLLWIMATDLPVLFAADMVLILCTYGSYVLQQVIMGGWVAPGRAYVLHHIMLTLLFAASAGFVFYRDWPWPQTLFFQMHTCVTYMKMHSYIVSNRRLARQRAELEKTDPKAAQQHPYPGCVNLANFTYFLFAPTLVYEPSYPMTNRVRLMYLCKRFIEMAGIMVLMYMLLANHVHPAFDHCPSLMPHQVILDIVVPCLVLQLLLFYFVWEAFCNFMAEITYFADRKFYDDWWNSTTWGEFAVKWNKPVHEFLLRHAYLELIEEYRLSPGLAKLLTFVFSSCLHEMIIAVITRRVRMYVFVLQMSQILWIYLAPWKHARKGNLFFWWGQTLGPPLLAYMYIWESYALPS
eukprot:comp20177_c0_seq1/m.25018 comp20177_c0_seq1/g.25018  ORF comp20177_c0_seq1/g.25018 comp20177_c0_seq1/m.25018 type:complete len:468 (-) comp20177_c0_seq1:42-1445(-)